MSQLPWITAIICGWYRFSITIGNWCVEVISRAIARENLDSLDTSLPRITVKSTIRKIFFRFGSVISPFADQSKLVFLWCTTRKTRLLVRKALGGKSIFNDIHRSIVSPWYKYIYIRSIEDMKVHKSPACKYYQNCWREWILILVNRESDVNESKRERKLRCFVYMHALLELQINFKI